MSSNGDAMPGGEVMERGVETDIMRETLESCASMEIRQYRRGWWQEFFCCQARSDFEFLNGKDGKDGNDIVATSQEDFRFVSRCCLGPCHAFDMMIKDPKSNTTFLEINRPFRCCPGTGKCLCNQEAQVFNGEEYLGEIKEMCWWCVPRFKIKNSDDKGVYMIQPPTCCNGMCVDCCARNSCPYGFCMIPCDVYPMVKGVVGDTPVARMAKIPKKGFKECYNEINYYKVDFPDGATAEDKGLLLGSSILINAVYFEHSE